MSTHLIYCCTRVKNSPVGLVLGDIFLSPTTCCFNPMANSVQLRVLREEDKNHPHLTDLAKSPVYFTLKVNGRSDIGSLMGFSGKQCYHFTMKTWLVLFLGARVITNGSEVALLEGPHNLFVQGDVRLVLDHSVAHVYLMRGNIYDNGKLCAQNKEHAFTLSMLDVNKTIECTWNSLPDKDPAPQVAKQPGQTASQAQASVQGGSLYVGMVKKADAPKAEAIALIAGHIHRAPYEPYRFGKSKSDFELIYASSVEGSLREGIERSGSLITISPLGEALTSLYSTSGHGFTIYKGATIKIIGKLIIVNNKDGSLVSSFSGQHLIEQLSGHLKAYVCDDSVVLLDNKTKNFQINGKVL